MWLRYLCLGLYVVYLSSCGVGPLPQPVATPSLAAVANIEKLPCEGNIDDTGAPLVDLNTHVIQKLVVIDEDAIIWDSPNQQNEVGKAPFWTFYRVFAHENHFCKIAPIGDEGRAIGWIDGKHVKRWDHLLAAQMKLTIQKNEIDFYEDYDDTNGFIRGFGKNAMSGIETNRPYAIINSRRDNIGNIVAYQVLVPTNNDKKKTRIAWVNSKHFNIVLFATRQHLMKMQQQMYSDKIKILNKNFDFDDFWNFFIVSQGFEISNDAESYAKICASSPLPPPVLPIEKNDQKENEKRAEEFARSIDKIDEILRTADWSDDQQKLVPIDIFPSYGASGSSINYCNN